VIGYQIHQAGDDACRAEENGINHSTRSLAVVLPISKLFKWRDLEYVSAVQSETPRFNLKRRGSN
jgi:hypothetical protein